MKNPEPLRYYVRHQLFYFIFFTFINEEYFNSSISDLTKMKESYPKQVENTVGNTVGKGEIARYKQFLLFPQCFQKVRFPEASKGVIVWEWVNSYHTIPTFNDLNS